VVRYISISNPGFTKDFSPSSITAGGISTLTFTISNLSPIPVSGVSFSDPLPAEPGQMVVATPPNASTVGCGSPTISAAPGSKEISLANASIVAEGTCILKVDVTAPVSGTYANKTNNLYIDGTDTGLSAKDDLNVISPPVYTSDLAVSKTDGVDQVDAGGVRGATTRTQHRHRRTLVDDAGLEPTAVVCSIRPVTNVMILAG
jgi:uncharacterized repeat protein (TIGR01451 family)